MLTSFPLTIGTACGCTFAGAAAAFPAADGLARRSVPSAMPARTAAPITNDVFPLIGITPGRREVTALARPPPRAALPPGVIRQIPGRTNAHGNRPVLLAGAAQREASN